VLIQQPYLLAVTTDGLAIGRRTVVVGGNKKALGSHSSTWHSSVYKPVSSFKRQVERLPDVGR